MCIMRMILSNQTQCIYMYVLTYVILFILWTNECLFRTFCLSLSCYVGCLYLSSTPTIINGLTRALTQAEDNQTAMHPLTVSVAMFPQTVYCRHIIDTSLTASIQICRTSSLLTVLSHVQLTTLVCSSFTICRYIYFLDDPLPILKYL